MNLSVDQKLESSVFFCEVESLIAKLDKIDLENKVVLISFFDESLSLKFYFALKEIGALVVLVNPNFNFQKIVTNVCPEFIFTTKKINYEIILENKSYTGYRLFQDCSLQRQKLIEKLGLRLGLSTSGTQGEPKVACFNEAAISWNTCIERELLKYTGHSSVLNLLTLSHDVGFYQCIAAIEERADLYIRRTPFLDKLSNTITKDITHISGIPFLWNKLLSNKDCPVYPNVRYITISAGSLDQEIILSLRAKFPNAKVVKTYGQTETFRSLASVYTIEDRNIGDETGVSQPWAKVKINDGKLFHQSKGQRTATLSKGHLLVDKDQWVDTADYFTEKDGMFYFQGRSDQRVKVKGELIDLFLIEAELEASLRGMKPLVFLKDGVSYVTIEGGSDNADNIKRVLNRKLPVILYPYKVVTLDSYPRTGSGKIDRDIIKEGVIYED